MRIPTVNKTFNKDVVSTTRNINFFYAPDMIDNSWREEDKAREKLIKKIEKYVRGSVEYRKYINYLKEEIDMNSCAFFINIDRKEDKVSIEIHHAPLTLFDITSIIFDCMHAERDDVTPFDVAEEVTRAHFQGMVGLIPLSQTVHELVHDASVFIPVDKVYGNVKGFYKKYKNGFSEEQVELLRQNIEVTKSLSHEEYIPSKLTKHITYLNVDGVTLPKYIVDPEVQEETA